MSSRLPNDDADLIRLAAGGSEEAICEVIERFGRCITSVVSRYASRSADRDDLRSEVIVKLLANNKRALRSWEPRASFAAYVATIAARHCMDWLRRRGRLPRVRLSRSDEAGPDGLLEEIIAAQADSDPEHLMAKLERRDAMRNAIDGLSDDDRLVLYLRFDQDLTGVEISDLLGISHGAARQRLFRAIRRLGDQLQQVCPQVLEAKDR